MKNITKKLIYTILAIIALQLSSGLLTYAASNGSGTKEASNIQNQYTETQKTFTKSIEFWRIAKLKSKNFKERVSLLRDRSITLQDELAGLDMGIMESQRQIDSIQAQISRQKDTAIVVSQDLSKAYIWLNKENNRINSYMQVLNEKQRLVADKQSGETSTVLLLASGAPWQDVFEQEKFAKVAYNTGTNMVNNLENATNRLTNKRVSIEVSRVNLEAMTKLVEENKKNIKEQKIAKQRLLEITAGQEGKYQELLYQAGLEQDEIEAEISGATSQLIDIQKQLKKVKYENEKNTKTGNRNMDKKEQELQAQVQMGLITEQEKQELFDKYEKDLKKITLDTGSVFVWPIPPKRGISSYFDDIGYKKRFKRDHGALDIPTPQGTPVLAPADSYVYKARKAKGSGYSYVILAHSNGLMTLYGHVSDVLVKKGDILKKGDVIALSGGKPGTNGAGLLTTGAHLHFEVHQDGVKVNPLKYLPLSYLPDRSLLEAMKYVDQ